jgi:hypothetical protein
VVDVKEAFVRRLMPHSFHHTCICCAGANRKAPTNDREKSARINIAPPYRERLDDNHKIIFTNVERTQNNFREKNSYRSSEPQLLFAFWMSSVFFRAEID